MHFESHFIVFSRLFFPQKIIPRKPFFQPEMYPPKTQIFYPNKSHDRLWVVGPVRALTITWYWLLNENFFEITKIFPFCTKILKKKLFFSSKESDTFVGLVDTSMWLGFWSRN